LNDAKKLAAAQACAALLKWLQEVTPEEVARMRGNLKKRGQKQEESRDWGFVGKEWKEPRGAVLRTRTGMVYR
jgi:hypothetical protein